MSTQGHGATPITKAKSGKKKADTLWPPNPPVVGRGIAAPTRLIVPFEVEEGVRVYRASSLGDCLPALAWMAAGNTPAPMPQVLRKALDQGTENEPRILEMLKLERGLRPATFPELTTMKEQGQIAGYEARSKQVQVRIPVGKTAVVRGHLDDLMTPFEAIEFCVVEAKAFAPSTLAKFKKGGLTAFPGYEWQLSIAMVATGLPALFVIGEKDEDGIVQSILVLEVSEPPKTKAQILARVMKADGMARTEEYGECAEGNWPCPAWEEYFCPDREELKTKKVEALQELDDLELGELCKLARAYQDDESEAKALRKPVTEAIDKLISEKGYARGVEVLVKDKAGNRFKFQWVQQSGPTEPKPAGTWSKSYAKVELVK